MSALSQEEVLAVYRKRARHYDLTANLYYLIGFREWAYRKKAVAALELHSGDTVVEICCGTGLNFTLLQRIVGPGGRIIGVDMNDAMLARARDRVMKRGWRNVTLVQSDAAAYQFPEKVNGIISTFGLTLVPAFDAVIRDGTRALVRGGRWVVCDMKLPANRLSVLATLGVGLTRPFAVSTDLATRHPWESIRRHTGNLRMQELYGGFAYVAGGTKLSTTP